MKRLLVLVVLATMALTGCTLVSATGGGWMEGKISDKATFGFDIVCNESSGYLNGTWVYQDKEQGEGVNAHGTLTDTSGGWGGGIKCFLSNDFLTRENDTDFLKVSYSAKPCPKDGPCVGKGLVRLDDKGLIGPDKGDILSMKFKTGPYAGYGYWSKEIQGGNLKVVED